MLIALFERQGRHFRNLNYHFVSSSIFIAVVIFIIIIIWLL